MRWRHSPGPEKKSPFGTSQTFGSRPLSLAAQCTKKKTPVSTPSRSLKSLQPQPSFITISAWSGMSPYIYGHATTGSAQLCTRALFSISLGDHSRSHRLVDNALPRMISSEPVHPRQQRGPQIGIVPAAGYTLQTKSFLPNLSNAQVICTTTARTSKVTDVPDSISQPSSHLPTRGEMSQHIMASGLKTALAKATTTIQPRDTHEETTCNALCKAQLFGLIALMSVYLVSSFIIPAISFIHTHARILGLTSAEMVRGRSCARAVPLIFLYLLSGPGLYIAFFLVFGLTPLAGLNDPRSENYALAMSMAIVLVLAAHVVYSGACWIVYAISKTVGARKVGNRGAGEEGSKDLELQDCGGNM